MDPWVNKKFCDRCDKSLTDGFSMSRFNTDALCFDCLEEERQHPDYQKAVNAELAALKRGAPAGADGGHLQTFGLDAFAETFYHVSGRAACAESNGHAGFDHVSGADACCFLEFV